MSDCSFTQSTLNIHWSGYKDVWTKLLPSWHKFCVHHTAIHQFTVSFYLKPHIQDACVFTCHLHYWQNDLNHLCTTVWHGGGTNTKVRISIESWPWAVKNILQLLLPGSEPKSFWSWVQHEGKGLKKGGLGWFLVRVQSHKSLRKNFIFKRRLVSHQGGLSSRVPPYCLTTMITIIIMYSFMCRFSKLEHVAHDKEW